VTTLVTFKVRGDTAANWTSVNPVLADREIAIETDTRRIKIGDGATAWNALGYAEPGPSAPITASEALAAGNLCNVYSTGAAARVRKASAADLTKPANGFVIAAVANAAVATVRFIGQVVTGLAGLTPGQAYFLDTVAGGLVAAPPSASGNGVQEVGFALTATSLLFHPKTMIGV
jgi:hypothetical protein